jgi:hypothetical protein
MRASGAAAAVTGALSGVGEGGTTQRQADAAATRLLAAFAVPPGASRLHKMPALPAGWQLAGPVAPSTSYVADKPQLWQFTGSAAEVIAWEKSHVSRAFARNGTGAGSQRGTVIEDDAEFDLPAVPGEISERFLYVEAMNVGHGQTAIRADGIVYWLPPRPASERVPGTAASVTVSEQFGADLAGHSPVQVTINDQVRVPRLVALVNALPRYLVRSVSCPLYYFRMGLTLTFRATQGGPPMAVASTFRGCGAVHLTLNGRVQPQLGPDAPFTAEVLKLTGLRWKSS